MTTIEQLKFENNNMLESLRSASEGLDDLIKENRKLKSENDELKLQVKNETEYNEHFNDETISGLKSEIKELKENNINEYMIIVEEYVGDKIPKQHTFNSIEYAVRFMFKLINRNEFHAIFIKEDDVFYNEMVPVKNKTKVDELVIKNSNLKKHIKNYRECVKKENYGKIKKLMNTPIDSI